MLFSIKNFNKIFARKEVTGLLTTNVMQKKIIPEQVQVTNKIQVTKPTQG